MTKQTRRPGIGLYFLAAIMLMLAFYAFSGSGARNILAQPSPPRMAEAVVKSSLCFIIPAYSSAFEFFSISSSST